MTDDPAAILRRTLEQYDQRKAQGHRSSCTCASDLAEAARCVLAPLPVVPREDVILEALERISPWDKTRLTVDERIETIGYKLKELIGQVVSLMHAGDTPPPDPVAPRETSRFGDAPEQCAGARHWIDRGKPSCRCGLLITGDTPPPDRREQEKTMQAKYAADHAQMMLAADGSMMCEKHPGHEWGTCPGGPDCAGPGMPWHLSGRTLIEEVLAEHTAPAPPEEA